MTAVETVTFFCPGVPVAGGSKRFVGIGKNTGRAILVDAGGVRNKAWRSVVATVGAGAMEGRQLLHGALRVEFDFVLPRAKGHFGKRGLLGAAPKYPLTRPDCSKLIRAVEDALTKVVWADDAQIVQQVGTKRYAGEDGKIGCWVTVTEPQEEMPF